MFTFRAGSIISFRNYCSGFKVSQKLHSTPSDFMLTFFLLDTSLLNTRLPHLSFSDLDRPLCLLFSHLLLITFAFYELYSRGDQSHSEMSKLLPNNKDGFALWSSAKLPKFHTIPRVLAESTESQVP